MEYSKSIKTTQQTLLHIVLFTGAFLFFVPFVWMVIASFKRPVEITALPFRFFPDELFLGNYRRVFEETQLARALLNSLIMSGIATLSVLFTSSWAGFVFAKMRFRGNKVLFVFVLSSLFFPPHVVLIPLYLLLARLQLINTYAGLVLPLLVNGFGVFLLRQFISGISDDLIDAALIDGAGYFLIYRRLIVPLTAPALSVLGILIFLWTWDEFLWALVVVSTDDMKTVPLMLSHFTRAHGAQDGPAMAGSTIVTIPILIVYAFFQKNFVKGMSMTGMKY